MQYTLYPTDGWKWRIVKTIEDQLKSIVLKPNTKNVFKDFMKASKCAALSTSSTSSSTVSSSSSASSVVSTSKKRQKSTPPIASASGMQTHPNKFKVKIYLIVSNNLDVHFLFHSPASFISFYSSQRYIKEIYCSLAIVGWPASAYDHGA